MDRTGVSGAAGRGPEVHMPLLVGEFAGAPGAAGGKALSAGSGGAWPEERGKVVEAGTGSLRERAAGAGAGARGATRFIEPLKLALEVASAILRTVVLVAAAALRLVRSPRLKSLQDHVVVVTGAGHGLGRELALQMAECGCRVVCIDIQTANNEATAQAITLRHPDRPARAYTCDVGDAAQAFKTAEAVLADVGHVDILVNNAGIMPVQPMLRTSPQQVVDVINVNLMAHFWMLLKFLPGMVSRNSGHVVAISSMAGITGLANKVPYSASKFAVAGLMDALSEELRLDARNIKVTCVHPYFIYTRPDLPEDLHLRIPELRPECAAADIVRAVREDAACVTVPRNLLFWINVLRTLPQDARNVWRDVFYARVAPVEGPRPATATAAVAGTAPAPSVMLKA